VETAASPLIQSETACYRVFPEGRPVRHLGLIITPLKSNSAADGYDQAFKEDAPVWFRRKKSSSNVAAPAKTAAGDDAAPADKKPKAKRTWKRFFGTVLLFLIVALVIARLCMPIAVRWYVNRTIDRSPIYHGSIGDVSIHLWKGAYSIENIRLDKTTGNVPVPLFYAKRVDLAIQWNALLHRRIVGQIDMLEPELNFVDAGSDADSQTGVNGPWLEIIKDLFPFKINAANVHNGSIHFHAFQQNPPVNVYIAKLNASVENLSNITDDIAPLMATVTAHGLAMDHAELDYQMKFDPTSYHPSFEMAVKLVGLDVTKVNDLSRAYGSFDFESGWFDLVIEMESRGGLLTGYIKPLFRHVRIIGKNDIKEDNPLQVFWEALIGSAKQVLSNPPRDQFGTVIPVHGDFTGPKPDLLLTIGNVLRNAFIRAYLPKLEGTAKEIDPLQFETGSVTDPDAPGNEK